MSARYNNFFYEELRDGSLSSARAIIPLVMEFVNPKSVIDVGCGIGTWLSVFRENGVKDITGVDGSWVDKKLLLIPEKKFFAQNIEEPFSLNAKADMAVCIEVAEHIPEQFAPRLIEVLASAAPVILFSAAIPLQGGACHVNEQWPDYWALLFEQYDYIPVDCLRRKIWNDKRVSFFYAQNLLIYVSRDALSRYPKLVAEVVAGNSKALPLVHPYKYLYFGERWELIVPFLGKIPPSILHKVKKILKRLAAIRRKK